MNRQQWICSGPVPIDSVQALFIWALCVQNGKDL
jgi:hypothetical protein